VLGHVLAAAGLIATFSLGAADPARARVVVTIDKSTQRMTVAVGGETRHVFAVSTGRAGFGTPNGQFSPQRLARTWFSKKYYNSPMPHSIFFHGGYAIHGSHEIRRLGGPASHGCVRLHPADAAALFALVKTEGTENTSIVVTGSNPAPARSRLLARSVRERPPAVAEPRLLARSVRERPPAMLPAAGLSGIGRSGAGIPAADLSGAGLSGIGRSGAGVPAADLPGAGLRDAALSHPDLSGSRNRHAVDLGRRRLGAHPGEVIQ
jgi:hypothetical protein